MSAGAQRIAVIGAGAVGGAAAAAMSLLGHDLTLCVRRHFERLVVDTDDAHYEVQARVVTDPTTLAVVDWVLLATKAQDTVATTLWLERLVGPTTIVVILQNGIDQVERIAPLLKTGSVLPAVVYSPGEMIAPGHVLSHGSPRWVVPAGNEGAALARVAKGGILTVNQCEDFDTARWRKFLLNICVNPITALTMCPMGIMRDPDLLELVRGLLAEGARVGRAAGARLDDDELERMVEAILAHDPEGASSMYFDRQAQRPMEHEYLTGALVRIAERHLIDVPLNRSILALLRALQTSFNHQPLRVECDG